MKIACNECLQRLSEALDETAISPAPAELSEHLAACESCRAELELLRAARAELRAFPLLAAPTDLRARIRAELETSPESASSVAAATPIVTPPTASQNAKPARHNWRESFRAFLRHPTNITWASCAVIVLFYFVSLSRPPRSNGKYENVKPAPIGEPYRGQFKGKDDGDTPVYQAPRRIGPDMTVHKERPPLVTLPEAPLPPRFQAPDKPTAVEQQPLTSMEETLRKNFSPPSSASGSAASGSTASGSAAARSKTHLPSPALAAEPAASAPAHAAQNKNSQDTRDDAAARKAAGAPAPENRRRSFFADGGSSPSAAGPSGPAGPDSSENASARAEPTAKLTLRSKAITREITTRITPPRSIGWAQISVELPDNAHFPGGDQLRVIWRGAAQANEPIDLQFTVQSAPDAANAKITLQEIKNGNAQDVAYKTIVLGTVR